MTSPPLVDVHSHFMAPGVDPTAFGEGPWAWLAPKGDRGVILTGDRPFRRVDRPCWDPVHRLEALDRAGIGIQVISPVPVALSYWADPRPALAYARTSNDLLAAAAASSERLIALGMVPLQDTDLAVAELTRVVTDLGLPGVEIGTAVGDDDLASPRLHSFFAAAEDLGAAVFVHPVDGARFPRCDDPVRAFGIGMLADTALAADALVFGGVLADFPSLRICLSHGGGAFAWCYPRLCYGRSRDHGTDGPLDQFDELAARLYVDSLVFSTSHRTLVEERFGPEHIAFGSDYPFIALPGPGSPAPGLEPRPTSAAVDFLFGPRR